MIGTSRSSSSYVGNDFIVAIGNANAREKIRKRLIMEGLNVISLKHPFSVVAENVTVGIGTVIMAGTVIEPYTSIGDGCIVNTCSSVDHDCCLENFVHVAVGAHIAGSVFIGSRTWIGASATVSNDIKISSDNVVGAGAVVVKDLTIVGVYVGVPARMI